METGRTAILLNLENLYESLYDLLNQVCIHSSMYVCVCELVWILLIKLFYVFLCSEDEECACTYVSVVFAG